MIDSNRTYDVIVYGATGFSGRLIAEHMLAKYGVGRDTKWAMAGRSRSKLEARCTSLVQ